MTPLAPKVDPENMLNTSSNPSMPQVSGSGPNDGTFIQNITNNYILENKKDKAKSKEDSFPKEEQQEKQTAKEQENQKEVKCHCHLSK